MSGKRNKILQFDLWEILTDNKTKVKCLCKLTIDFL